MEALPKKRRHHITGNPSFVAPKTGILKCQALWYSTFIAIYIWFLYWVSYDFFVLQKSIVEVNLMNLAGSITSIAFLWAGTGILKRRRAGTQKLKQRPCHQKPPQETFTKASTCAHHLGYLNQRQKQQEIPSECLTCEKVIQCFSSQKE